jgi:hypothetical protein
VARLDVTLRPPPPTEIKIDFNNLGNETAADTEPGFASFALDAATTTTTRRSYGGADVTLSGVGVTMESRKRPTPVNGGDFTEERLLQDFIFARDTSPATGMDIAVEFLETNQSYAVTVWSFDSGSTGSRTSDWLANGTEVQTAWTFDGTVLPTTNDRYRFGFNANSDSSGKILIQGRRTSGASGAINVFINALKVTRRDLRIVSVNLNGFGEVHLVIEVLNPAASHRILEATAPGQTGWTEVQGVVFSGPNGYILEATFTPDTPPRFYRVVEGP